MITDNFIKRHLGPRDHEVKEMLAKIGLESIEELIDQTVPAAIRQKEALSIAEGLNEYEYLCHLREIGSSNKIFRSFIGMGYYNTITPPVILRNILENPGWYTSYTPYQAEISQGRLEALLNFQTMVCDLTAMPIANASLLDEATAAAEAMTMLYNSRSRAALKRGANRFLVAEGMFPHTIEVLKNRALPLGIELCVSRCDAFEMNESTFGMMLQYPDQKGAVYNYTPLVEEAHSKEIFVAVASDILSLTLLTPPGEWGADVVVGTTQRFGIPMGFGGPHAAFFATTDNFKRNIPGRIIGVSVDREGKRALRMALQTREQHIKRERATSNICTAQALLATMAGMYGVYHGPDGLKQIARHINILTAVLNQEVQKYGYKQLNTFFFDTLYIEIPADVKMADINKLAIKNNINLRYIGEKHLGVSVDETTTLEEINTLLHIFAESAGKEFNKFICNPAECMLLTSIPEELMRKSDFMRNEVFCKYHSETDLMRYIKKLEIKDLSLNRSMIPLGSCTMKLNAAAQLLHLSWPEFGQLHPFIPADQAEGYLQLIAELEKDLCEITGFAAMSFMPNSGAAGEYTGLLVISAYHQSRGESHRDICLIPSSAHGTNPASAIMAGLKVVVVKCDENGNIDIDDLRQKAEEHKENLSSIMLTYPSTHGVFEEGVLDVIKIIHDCGGQVYMDGANMNAQVGLTNPGLIGADVCHLNLHKTFAIPHGGGGPGVGPIGVAAHLKAFLPGHIYFKTGGEEAIGAVAAAPFGSAFILPISYGYIKMMGGKGLTDATKYAILNANYLKKCLQDSYKVLYTGKMGHVAHEMILDCNEFSRSAGVEVIDIAKRMMDYGFHAPTVAFPVHGTLMVEPTESEPLYELNRFVEAMLAIREEIAEIQNGTANKEINPVKMAPHTMHAIASENWDRPYSREKAAFPTQHTKDDKYWPSVGRIDDAYGDRNLVCTCYQTLE